MNVKEIVEKYLRENGYDGLAGEDCGCGIEEGLAPCESCNISECVPAYRVMCDGKPGEDDNHDCIGFEHEMFATERLEQEKAGATAGDVKGSTPSPGSLSTEDERAMRILDGMIHNEAQIGLAHQWGPKEAKSIMDSWFSALAVDPERIIFMNQIIKAIAEIERGMR